MIDSVLSLGVQGVRTGVADAQQAAQAIAQAGTVNHEQDLGSLTEAVVNLKRSEHQVQASAAVIKTADEVLGTLIDVSV